MSFLPPNDPLDEIRTSLMPGTVECATPTIDKKRIDNVVVSTMTSFEMMLDLLLD